MKRRAMAAGPPPQTSRRGAGFAGDRQGARPDEERDAESGHIPAVAWVGLGLVLLAVAAIHHGALRAPFFADDYLFLDQVRDRGFIAALTAPDPLGNYFRPLSRQVLFWLLAHATGENPLAFHALNLALFLAVPILLFRIVAKLMGPLAGSVAAATVALHYAADVPVLWASGSQDLLAVTFALAAIELHRQGRSLLAGTVLLAGLLSKETVVLAPLAAVLVTRRPQEGLMRAARRAWPLFAALGSWLLLWLLTVARRPAIGLEVKPDLASIPAAFAHLIHVGLGLEWSRTGFAGGIASPPFLALALAIAGVVVTARGAGQPPGGRRRALLVAGVGWALCGAAPVIAVAHIWSAYYYLFSVCGLGLVLAALMVGRPLWLSLLILVLLGWSSEHSRRRNEFAMERGAWTAQSHLNRFYMERGMRAAARYLHQLQSAKPELPPNATLFFAGLRGSVAFQSADGPLVRWAYRDSSLRSYYLTRFSLELARRGPVLFFNVEGDSLREITGPGFMNQLAFGMLASDAPEAARDAMTLAVEQEPADALSHYWLGLVQIATGDVAGARVSWGRAGVALDPGPAPQIPAALAAIARGDTAAAARLVQAAVTRYGLDAGAHALLADLLLARGDRTSSSAIEAYAARVLAPENPASWKRWAGVQVVQSRHLHAAASLEHYFELGGPAARADAEAVALHAELRRLMPGGDLAQEELRK